MITLKRSPRKLGVLHVRFHRVLYLCETPVRHISDPIVSDVTTFCGRLGDAAGNTPHRTPGPNVCSATTNYKNEK